MTQIRYVSKHLWESLQTGALTVLTSLLALAVAFLLLGICGIALVRQEALVPDWLPSDRIVAYLDGNAPGPEIDRLVREVSGWQEVEQVQLVTRKEAHEQLKTMLGRWKGVLEGLDEEFLPPSVQIRMKQPVVQAVAEELVSRLGRLPSVVEILYGKAHGEWLQSLVSQWTNVWTALGAILLFVVVLIISHAVRLVFMQRKTEVTVYRLVGATPSVVKLPYYVEGVLLGTMGAALAAGAVAALGAQAQRVLPAFWSGALSWTDWEGAALLGGMVGCGAACGWLGSWMGLGRSR